jgi:DNA-binding PadR family transcriptional regulator
MIDDYYTSIVVYKHTISAGGDALMLPKVHALILGMIKERPINPYEITKLLDYIHINDWFPVAASSVYATIRNLQQKGFITGTVKKDGNMPEKTVYSITEAGEKEICDTLMAYLGSTDLDNSKFNIACIMLCHLEKEKVLEILRQRLIQLRGIAGGIRGQIDALKASGRVPVTGISAVRHNLYLIEAEITSTEELIADVERDTTWNHFLTLDTKL